MPSSLRDPPRVTLVSFLGNPSRSVAKLGGASGPIEGVTLRTPSAIAEYETTPYRFEDGFIANTLFFGWAALLHLRHRACAENRPHLMPARWLVIGTPSSAWHMMSEVAIEADLSVFDVAANWSTRVRDAWQLARERNTDAANAGPLHDLLREFERTVAGSLGTDLCLRAIDDSSDSVFACLRDNLDTGSSVILDITHGFRTMPVRATLALGALRWLKSIDVADILYGGIEKKGAAQHAPAVSLATSARIARATPALAQLALFDDVGQIGDFFETDDPEMALRLREAQRYESLMQFGKAAGPRGQALGRLRGNLPTGRDAREVTKTVANSVVDTLTSLNGGTGSVGLRNRAERALQRGDFMRALSLANEMLLLRAVELRGLNGKYEALNKAARNEVYRQLELPKAPKGTRGSPRANYTTLNYLRNAVMHPDGGIADQGAPGAIKSRSDMRALLEWALEFYGFMA
jgi:CRISPR-associated Csx2 family protein